MFTSFDYLQHATGKHPTCGLAGFLHIPPHWNPEIGADLIALPNKLVFAFPITFLNIHLNVTPKYSADLNISISPPNFNST